jgi:hypothetical protein
MKFQPEILAAFANGKPAPWIFCGLAICFITACVVIVRRKNKTQHRRTRSPVPAPVIKNRSGVNHPAPPSPPVAIKSNPLDGHAWPKPVFRHKRRKRIFNHFKFYASVMKELSLHSHHPGGTTNGKSHANGHSHGHVVSNGTNVNQTIKSEMEDLMANQEMLIQTQKSILEEQARLIEEKNRIIEEQMAFLKMKRAA